MKIERAAISIADARVIFAIPVRTYSESNTRSHWAAKAKRARQQRMLSLLVSRQALAELSIQVSSITLTRVGGRRLDVGNLAVALKAVQDGLCDALGVSDGDSDICWEYRQRLSRGVASDVEVTIGIKRWLKLSTDESSLVAHSLRRQRK